MVHKIIIPTIIFVIFSQAILALDDSSYTNGWYWGKDSVHEKDIKPQPEDRKIIASSNSNPKSNSEILSDISKEVEELKAKAILEPTVSNVANYVAMQNKVVNLASEFTTTWSQTMLLRPELNYIAKNPTNNYAQQIINAEKQNNIKSSIANFANNYGFIFFFNGNDKLSTFQSKVIKAFANKHDIAIIPVALNGIVNESFPMATPDSGRANKLEVKVAPTIIAMNVRTGEASPLAVGIISEMELEERIYTFLSKGY
ncbi:MAG: conjugal transfer protein TraF [Rickettsiaceae bacterium]|nr:conjugal transfer protein TraF [Rickettsiaceae bacterium]